MTYLAEPAWDDPVDIDFNDDNKRGRKHIGKSRGAE